MAARNSIDTKQDPSAIIAVRVFNAPRDLVFEAFTDPRHLMHWWGPNGFTLTTHTCDVRAGGVWRFVMHGPDGRDYQNRITYEEIVRPERLVYRHGGGDDVEPVKFQVTVTFEDIGGKTRLTMRMQFPSEDERNRVIAEYGADKGLVQTLGQLEQHLATNLEREVILIREFDAPRRLVFAAWTDPKHLANWWGPKDFTTPVCEMDLRVGGALRIVMRGPDGVGYPMSGTFREIVVPERLVITCIPEDATGNPLFEVLTTATFVETNGKTTLTLSARPVKAPASAGAMLAGMETGWSQSLDRLGTEVAGMA